ncbi:hypothetical protein [Enterococcus cecorum]|uniref:hypothetical protein n=1 Tax=Enterococcus cecorum TaxID=44008 RepID=UPI00200B839A|nr:hypothetical protein [Enterococcus cecorum]
MAKFITEQQVKDALQIETFRNLSKDKIMEFASLLPQMDKDVAISIIQQFPAFAENSRNIVKQLVELCNAALEKNNENHKANIYAYLKILDELGELLKKEYISSEEREKIINDMITVADKINEINNENRKFISQIAKYGLSIGVGALALSAVVLGANIKGIDIPKLK